MQIIHLFLCFLITLSWISTTDGLTCASCTDISLRSTLTPKPECAEEVKGLTHEIREETCAETSGKVSRCGFYKGLVRLTARQYYMPDFNSALHIYQRGCYHFRPENVPSDGCYDIKNITEYNTFIKQIVEKASSKSRNYDTAIVAGEMCLMSVSPLPTTTINSLLSTTTSNGLPSTTTSYGLPSATTSNGPHSRTTSGVTECAKRNTMLLLFSALVYFI